MNPSDFIITVSIGSAFATMLLAKEVSLVDGLVALTALVLLQTAIEWTTTRSRLLRAVAEGSPVLLMYRGNFLRHNMRVNNVSEQEVLASLRAHQVADPAEVEAVVLEIDGDLSVLPRQPRDAPVLRDVRRQS